MTNLYPFRCEGCGQSFHQVAHGNKKSYERYCIKVGLVCKQVRVKPRRRVRAK